MGYFAQITVDSTFTVAVGALFPMLGALVYAVWRAANFVRDNSEELRMLRKEIEQAWTLRDQEKWVLHLERENRSRGNSLYVPDVVRAGREGA